MRGTTRVHSRTFLFVRCVNNMPQGVKPNLFLYTDDSCLAFFQGNDVIEVEKQLKRRYICEWFVGNRLSIHLGEDKTKSILFACKRNIEKVPQLNITYENGQIKQHSKVTYLGCILDEAMSGDTMALNLMNKINWRLNISNYEKLCLNSSVLQVIM